MNHRVASLLKMVKQSVQTSYAINFEDKKTFEKFTNQMIGAKRLIVAQSSAQSSNESVDVIVG